jgi:hypothetical protein
MPWTLLLGPAIGEQGKEIVAGRSETESRKLRENIPQVGEGIQTVLVATGDQTEMNSSGLSAPLAAAE